MTANARPFTPELLAYLGRIATPEHPVLAEIRAQSRPHRLGKMAAAPEQTAFLALLAQMAGVKNYLEIGTFTGITSTAVALALPDDARLSCCDISVTFTDIARRNWQHAGVAHKITLHLQPAVITLDEMLSNGRAGTFDLIFIDADKPPTPHYFERSLKLVRQGGIIAIDNLLLNGRILNQADAQSPASLKILQDFNAALPHDPRIATLTLPLGDGLTLAVKQ
ncbi:MAG: methyltransferase [Kingella sp. (in: b-proteobacteria)]|nr:O-methyltransferase [uncultured Kingella sp.]RKW27343.1 MAG: methyltransferase [Kingella sp. (in: b-proteobacteria)]